MTIDARLASSRLHNFTCAQKTTRLILFKPQHKIGATVDVYVRFDQPPNVTGECSTGTNVEVYVRFKPSPNITGGLVIHRVICKNIFLTDELIMT